MIATSAPDMEPFPVFEDDRVRATGGTTPHGRVFLSVAFRFDTDDGSVPFAGDTARSKSTTEPRHARISVRQLENFGETTGWKYGSAREFSDWSTVSPT